MPVVSSVASASPSADRRAVSHAATGNDCIRRAAAMIGP
jgi:hypothetical protein